MEFNLRNMGIAFALGISLGYTVAGYRTVEGAAIPQIEKPAREIRNYGIPRFQLTTGGYPV